MCSDDDGSRMSLLVVKANDQVQRFYCTLEGAVLHNRLPAWTMANNVSFTGIKPGRSKLYNALQAVMHIVRERVTEYSHSTFMPILREKLNCMQLLFSYNNTMLQPKSARSNTRKWKLYSHTVSLGTQMIAVLISYDTFTCMVSSCIYHELVVCVIKRSIVCSSCMLNS